MSSELREVPSQSADVLLSRIRSLIGDDRISSARDLAEAALRQHPDSEALRTLLKALKPGTVTRAHLRDSSHRANMEWLTQHQEEHKGSWVALLNGKLAAANADLGELMKVLSNLGSEDRPLIHHIRD